MTASYTPWTTTFSAKAPTSPTRAVEISEEFTLRSLGDGGGNVTSGKVVHQLVGQKLLVQVSENLKPGTCVRIDCEDAFVLGEVLACWGEPYATFAVVKLRQALTGLEELAQVCGQYRELPSPLKPELLRGA
jgi:hypothetical protein